MTLAGDEHKAAELRIKLAGLTGELARWGEASAPGEPLEKHNSQIRALACALGEGAALTSTRIERRAEIDGWIVEDAPAIEAMILELHRVWDWFRAKLALRHITWFQRHLSAADDFAWHCYLPAQEAAGEREAKAPPLVYFTASPPLTLPRRSSYLAAALPGAPLTTAEFEQMLDALPIPVIGIPWFQLEHLPDAPIIAHEVGHDVEFGLGLGARVRTLLNGALRRHVDAERRPAWRAWRHEVFADIYGTLAAGPGFVATLIDFLAAAPETIAAEWRGPGGWGEHPTAPLRVRVATAALIASGAEVEANCLEQRWRSAFPEHAMEAFDDDVAPVVQALIAGPWPELHAKALTSVITFDSDQRQAAKRAKDDALDGAQPATHDVRCLIAAARLAYDDDAKVFRNPQRDPPERILAAIEAARTAGTRLRTRPEAPVPQADLDERDRAAGRALTAFIDSAHQRRHVPTKGGRRVPPRYR